MKILASCNGKLLKINFRAADNLSLGTVGLHIIPKHLADQRDVRAAAAQERCRLECPHACTVHEIIGIDHDAGIKAAGLNLWNLNIIHNILQYL